ncbi:MAG TPA: DNA/RNA nuclease SfsA [Candidatus Sabulitectum sp.]|nr:DNA/RNA nuclease SfsA [Candidatus Sabulitectum sp.]HPR22799.1 DNA/RNA nuclease SfsA [Candidatus Sabulitectum sp.]
MSGPVMAEIPDAIEAVFMERPNRFLLIAGDGMGSRFAVHVPDPGRLRELLYPGNRLLVIPSPGEGRKTKWTLAAARLGSSWVLVNTTFHREIASRFLLGGHSPLGRISALRAEVKSPSGGSRFDFLVNDRLWLEVKGCTLLKNGVAMFPDAPTLRGRKHVNELMEIASGGSPAGVLFLVFVNGAEYFTANSETDPGFAEALRTAVSAGVSVWCAEMSFDGKRVFLEGELPFRVRP